ncbi:MAG: Wzz/FepE/Etk N-terminal domain-containing protein [Bacteroidia bacterium]|nr:Wzz/FepE/Etk N-terminal domain-containing protein [Bacteroidia bacterium]
MNNQESNLEIKSFLQLLLSRKKILLALILITAIISIIVSYIIPPKYKTIAVVYPVHLTPYSEESQTEQLLQYLNSIQVRDFVIKKMNLIQHYKIDTTQKEWRSILHYLYKENISFSPTLYESIEIEIRDKQPEKTKQIAECIIQTTDSMILGLRKKIIFEEYNNFQREIDKIQKRIDSLNQLLVNIQHQYNILDANYQARYLSKKLSNGKLDAENQKLVENLKNKKEYVQILQREIKEQIKSLGKLITERDRLEVDLNGDLHFIQVISPPYVPDKKYFPVRWLIVALSELAVIAIFIIYLLYIQPIKK